VTLPVGGVGGSFIRGGATAGAQLLRAGAVGAGQGAVTAGLNPVIGGNFAEQKGRQVVTGAALGAPLGVAGQGAVQLLQGALKAPAAAGNAFANAVSPQSPAQIELAISIARSQGDEATAQSLEAALQAAQQRMQQNVGSIQALVAGSNAQRRVGQRVSAQSGVTLSPAQASGSKTATMIENLARQSVFTRDRMFLGDQKRARQMINTIRQFGRDISPTQTSPAIFADRLQKMTAGMVTNLAKQRTEVAGGAYRQIDSMMGNAPVVEARKSLEAAARLSDEFQGSSETAGKIRAWAENFFSRLPPDGRMTAARAISELQGFEQAARTGTGLFEGITDRSTAKTAARRLQAAMMADLDESANTAGGTIGDSLRRANDLWRKYSSEIDAVEGSALGRIVGDDVVGELSGTSFNTVSPEALFQKLERLTPSELRVVRDYTQRNNPALWEEYKRLVLDTALERARIPPPSSRGRPAAITPSVLVRELEGSTGASGVNAQERLRVLFDDSQRLESILEAARRMADSEGKSFSGTAPADQAMRALEMVSAPIRQTAGALGTLSGLNVVARQSAPGAARTPFRAVEIPDNWLNQLYGRAAGVAGPGAVAADRILEIDVVGGQPISVEEARRLQRQGR